MSYTRSYRLDLYDSGTGRVLASMPDTQRTQAAREAIRLSLEYSGGCSLSRVVVRPVPVMVRPYVERAA